MDIAIISKERIKPSSPTPNHLRNFNLCHLDHLIPAPYAPIVLFYPNSNSSSIAQVLQRLLLLKESLSQTLTRFYPLAGTIKGDLSVDCDDQGAYYITTRIKSHLFKFLENPKIRSIKNFLPLDGNSVTNIQVNLFECGGIAIGVYVSHRIVDGTALSTFLNSWANTTFASSRAAVYPDFSASSLFPINDLRLKNESMAMWGALFKKGQFITKRFVFEKMAIAHLKAMATSNGRNPTRVEAISAFIWRSAMSVLEQKRGFKKPSLITHVVNLRKRAIPNFSEQSLGNLIWISSAKYDNTDKINNVSSMLPRLVHRLTKSISNIDGDYLKKLRSTGEASHVVHKYFQEIGEFVSNGSADYFGFTSWCNLGFYDADFGWGKPVWVSSVDSSGPFLMNLIILMDTRCGSGIEAWITMDEHEIAVLENNQEFKAFTSLNPSPLNTRW